MKIRLTCWRACGKVRRKVKALVCGKVEIIISAMVKSCLSVQEIAERAGVSANVVYRVRKGYMVKMERFGKVCKALGIAPEDVLDHEKMQRFQDRKHYVVEVK